MQQSIYENGNAETACESTEESMYAKRRRYLAISKSRWKSCGWKFVFSWRIRTNSPSSNVATSAGMSTACNLATLKYIFTACKVAGSDARDATAAGATGLSGTSRSTYRKQPSATPTPTERCSHDNRMGRTGKNERPSDTTHRIISTGNSLE